MTFVVKPETIAAPKSMEKIIKFISRRGSGCRQNGKLKRPIVRYIVKQYFHIYLEELHL